MKKYLILFIVAVLAVTVASAGCRAVEQEPPLPEEDPSEPATIEPPIVDVDIEELDTFGVGEEVIVGNIMWEITEVEDVGEQLTYEGFPGFLEPRVGKFVVVTFNIENLGEESRTIFDLVAIDDQGRNYSICLEGFAFFTPQEACVLQEIIPGVENTYVAPFDVATDVQELVLQVTDLRIPVEEAAYIELGLPEID